MASEDKKPRSDSTLDSMPGGRVLALRDKMLAGAAYRECKDWLMREYGVETSITALSGFYRRHVWPIIREQRQVSVMKAEAFGDAMREDPVGWDEVIIDKSKQLVFEFLTNGSKPADVADLLKALVSTRKQEFHEKSKTKDQELQERKLALMEAKAKQADAAKDVLKESLSLEEQNRRLREILK